MEETIKLILGEFLRIEPEKITLLTVIDKTAVRGSILVHRMYGTLANAGVIVNDYLTIKTYGELLSKVSSENHPIASTSARTLPSNEPVDGIAIGVDIESVSKMPLCSDFREDQFYKMNFTDQEISYCSIQENPLNSFTGLFAVKEAIVKADNLYKNVPFNQIEISHDAQGKPAKEGFQVSISHVNDLSLAVAIKERPTVIDMGMIEKLEEANALLVKQNKQLNSHIKNYGILVACFILFFVALAGYYFWI